eukprot:CAMPEP_0182856340 /NCGR_PEP_ID=MMETSP0034_2-20130328/2372_1 /TAXON_ID=156128 /ORGANISM="Nephroselmis pyriformis, Strain CCMP717" /LENGTH=154 /DNA_ID=CAMNT_0024987401 /DNA_START=37 /DNA_END=502 /DNA_ORIENTATION=+
MAATRDNRWRREVLKTQVCRFSGLKVYPGRGMVYVRTDCQVFLFLSGKCKSMYRQNLRPAKLAWCLQYRKAHKKEATLDVARKNRKKGNKSLTRSLVGASMEVLQKKRAEKTEVRAANRDAALREIKERTKKAKDAKKKSAAAKTKAAPPPKKR